MLRLHLILNFLPLLNLVIFKDVVCSSVLVTDMHNEDCIKGTNNDGFYEYNENNFPYCGKYSELYDEDGLMLCSAPNPYCPPGFLCPAGEDACNIDKTSCFKYYAKVPHYTDDLDFLLWAPTCLDDGTWAPKQCKGNSRCFCYDNLGTRIFGEASMTDATNMTCACSKRRSDLEKINDINEKRIYVSFHCDINGNYEPLQCDSGHCWCAEPTTGELRSLVVPESAKTLLKCYVESGNYGNQYLRKCESEDYAIKLLSHKLQLRGTELQLGQVFCQYDGSYGPYVLKAGQIFCVTKYKGETTYHVPKLDSPNFDIDCNCARDQADGRNEALECNPDGNYRLLQGTESKYCVDRDGFPKRSLRVPITETNETVLCALMID